MGKKIKVKPGKAQSMMGFFVGIVFCGIGLFIVIPTFGAFGIFWAIIAVIITVTNGINAFSEKGIATHSIEIEDTDKVVKQEESIESRLEKLKNLYQQNLITVEEYEKKKDQLLQEL
ncbi:SHOCT domain-containing protein [Sporanaerobium hydrogeniformans]|uniref:SHOCT domain-containing protein n=1 Tax=Sporanaerobium hydrogeniformans TaxID=3072179 RepID=UPI0026A5F5B0|nr:SHOCT domain-containing protein [Sporanaerobium hydrogeniformans]